MKLNSDTKPKKLLSKCVDCGRLGKSICDYCAEKRKNRNVKD